MHSRSLIRLTSCGAMVTATIGAASMAQAAPRTHDGFYLQLDGGLGYLNTSAEALGRFVYAPLSLNSVTYGTISPALLATFTNH